MSEPELRFITNAEYRLLVDASVAVCREMGIEPSDDTPAPRQTRFVETREPRFSGVNVCRWCGARAVFRTVIDGKFDYGLCRAHQLDRG